MPTPHPFRPSTKFYSSASWLPSPSLWDDNRDANGQELDQAGSEDSMTKSHEKWETRFSDMNIRDDEQREFSEPLTIQTRLGNKAGGRMMTASVLNPQGWGPSAKKRIIAYLIEEPLAQTPALDIPMDNHIQKVSKKVHIANGPNYRPSNLRQTIIASPVESEQSEHSKHPLADRKLQVRIYETPRNKRSNQHGVEIGITKTITERDAKGKQEHTVYLVRVQLLDSFIPGYNNALAGDFSIGKRYSDFARLYDQLQRIYGYSRNLPLFPDKTLFPMTPWVIRARLRMFRKFVQFLANDPILFKSPSVVDFLGGRPSAGTRYLQSATESPRSESGESDEYMTVMPVTARLVTPHDLERSAIKKHEAKGVSLHREAVLKLYHGKRF